MLELFVVSVKMLFAGSVVFVITGVSLEFVLWASGKDRLDTRAAFQTLGLAAMCLLVIAAWSLPL